MVADICRQILSALVGQTSKIWIRQSKSNEDFRFTKLDVSEVAINIAWCGYPFMLFNPFFDCNLPLK